MKSSNAPGPDAEDLGDAVRVGQMDAYSVVRRVGLKTHTALVAIMPTFSKSASGLNYGGRMLGSSDLGVFSAAFAGLDWPLGQQLEEMDRRQFLSAVPRAERAAAERFYDVLYDALSQALRDEARSERMSNQSRPHSA